MFPIYLRLLSYLRPYWRRVVLAIISIILFAALSGVSVTLVVPFLDNLFQEGKAQSELVDRTVADPTELLESGGGDFADSRQETPRESRLAEGGSHAGGSESAVGEDDLIERAKGFKDRVLGGVRGWLDKGSPGERLRRVLLVIFLAFFFKNLFGYCEAYLTNYLEQRCLYDLRQDLCGQLQGLPLSYFSGQKTGVLISRVVNDVNTLRGAIIGATANFLRNGLMILVFLTIVIFTNWKLALATLVIVPPNAWLMRRLGRLLRRDSTRIQVRMGEMAGLIQETVTGARVVKAFGREGDEVKRFDGFNRPYFLGAVRLRALGALNAPLSEMMATLSVVLIVGYGGHQVLQGAMPASYLVLFVTAMLSMAGPLKKVAELNQALQEGTAAGRRIFEILDREGEHSRLTGGAAPGPLVEIIRYEGVGFAYDERKPVLEGINLEIPRGQVVALVGPSGGGKSTLADLLPRFYEPDAGRITMDGRPIGDFSLRDWRAKMGIVTQDVVLFNDSILSNIAYGKPGASREEIEQAARAARAHDFILSAPEGYETVIGERGLQLSGGERQRLAIARAILRDPEILIFDEATSALDTESERLVQEAIERLMAGRTTLVIAHRLSTIQGADKIVVLQGGRIIQSGRHSDLLEQGGLYRQLHEMQFATES